MSAARAQLVAALDRLEADLLGLAHSLPRLDALEAYLDLARPLVDDCAPRDRPWVNDRVEENWCRCAAVRRGGFARSAPEARPMRRLPEPSSASMPIDDGAQAATPAARGRH